MGLEAAASNVGSRGPKRTFPDVLLTRRPLKFQARLRSSKGAIRLSEPREIARRDRIGKRNENELRQRKAKGQRVKGCKVVPQEERLQGQRSPSLAILLTLPYILELKFIYLNSIWGLGGRAPLGPPSPMTFRLSQCL